MLVPGRSGIASLITTRNGHYLIDTGSRAGAQLAALGLTPPDITAVVLTHLHDDHTAGLLDWASFRYTTAISAPIATLPLIGPPGTEALADATRALLEVSGAIRRDEDGASGPSVADVLTARTIGPFTAAGVVLEEAGIRITGVNNTHYSDRGVSQPGGSYSYSYRVELEDRVLAFTGDTGPSAQVADLLQGADVLVAEMVSDDISLEGLPEDYDLAAAQAGHLSPRQVGELARDTSAGRLVLSHYTNASQSDLDTISSVYDGPVAVGTDLMQV